MLSNSEQVIDELMSTHGTPKHTAIETINKFIDWRDKRTIDDFIQMEQNGVITSKAFADSIRDFVQSQDETATFGKSALTQNPWVKYLREELANHLQEINVLPDDSLELKEKKKKGTKCNPKEHDRQRRKAAEDVRRLNDLQELVLTKDARIRELEYKLEAHLSTENLYADLAKMGAEFGVSK